MIYTHLIAALLSAAMAFGGAWQIQNWRQGAKDKDRAELQITLDRESRTLERKRSQNVIDAQNSARVRDVALRRDSDLARAESDGLRDDLATLRRQLPGLADNAVRQYADESTKLLTDCAERYRGLAAEADILWSDRKTIIDAWPR